MIKLTDNYQPDVAKSRLIERFKNTPSVLEVIRKLHKAPLCSLAAMCDGYVLTTSGNNVNADYCINRASAIIHDLKQFNIPISTATHNVLSDVGGVATQAVFFISNGDLEMLENDPEMIMQQCAGHIRELKQTQAQKEINRLYKEYGEKGIWKFVRNACANDSPPDSDEDAS